MVHFNIHLDVSGVELEDGAKAVTLSFYDSDTAELHHFPIPIDLAMDIGMEICRISTELLKKES